MKPKIKSAALCWTILVLLATCKKDQANTAPQRNKPPLASAGADQAIVLPLDSTRLSGSGADPDGNIVSYSWRKVSGPSSFSIVDPDVAVTKVMGLLAGAFLFELKVTDDGGLSAMDTVMVTVSAGNQSPVANAGMDRTVILPNDSTELSGTGTDPDGHIVSYTWSKISGPSLFTIMHPTNAITRIKNLAYGDYVFELKVTDNGGSIASDRVTVSVHGSASNVPPIANAGADQILLLPSAGFDLSGSGTDADGRIVSYEWTITAYFTQILQQATYSYRTSNVRFSNPAEGYYWCLLKVIDDQGAWATDEVLVRVVSPNCPCYPDPCDGAGDPCDPWDY